MDKQLCFELIDGKKIPAIGLGTWMSAEDQLEEALNVAFETGYRHIDTAYGYQNEHIIGKALKKWFSSGKLSRHDVFVTTKLPPCGMQPERIQKYLKKSLESLQLEYVDLYLVHVPFAFAEVEGQILTTADDGTAITDTNIDHVKIWKAMEEQVKLGLTKSIGLSNFNVHQIARILNNCEIPPSNLQIEHHVYLQQPDLVKFCNDNDIVITAYSPLGSPGSPGLVQLGKEVPDILANPVVSNIAKKHNKSAAQVLLRHIIQKNIVVIPKSVNPGRIRENFNVFDFKLTDEDVQELNGLTSGLRIYDFEFMFKGIQKHPEYPFTELL